ncbi:SLAM family member 9 [Sarcophilus harrisii]|uniref:SLAM family member 9 n=1 Tax=Sarcophilus harrisii TaxID=9305 RepID=G3WB44_SARHA|nr:SLAM family member 9 [Sarcophilus harrisii]XP_031822704.1 SLAM family member 9 [Sarcophilus harrisii]
MKVHPWVFFFLMLLHSQEGEGQSGEEPETEELMAILGESIIFPINIPEGEQIEKIIWVFQSPLATIKKGAGEKLSTIIVSNPRYKVLVDIPDQIYSLQISNLSKEDEGMYRANIVSENALDTITRKFTLRVYRRLPKPKVTIYLEISEEFMCNVTLKCHVDGRGEDEEYGWTPLGPRAVVSNGGSVLHLSWKPGDSDLTSTCIVRNPVSLSSHSLQAGQFCTGPRISSSASCSPLAKGLFILLLLGILTVSIIVIRVLTKNKKAIERIHRMKLRRNVKREKMQAKEFPLASRIPE